MVVALVLVAAACGGSESTPTISVPLGPGDIDRGQSVYKSTCAACHGGDATGIDGLGATLVGSEFVGASSESELVEFVKVGRRKDHPDNTTGRDMPRYGGNNNLGEQQLSDVAAYLISLGRLPAAATSWSKTCCCMAAPYPAHDDQDHVTPPDLHPLWNTATSRRNAVPSVRQTMDRRSHHHAKAHLPEPNCRRHVGGRTAGGCRRRFDAKC